MTEGGQVVVQEPLDKMTETIDMSLNKKTLSSFQNYKSMNMEMAGVVNQKWKLLFILCVWKSIDLTLQYNAEKWFNINSVKRIVGSLHKVFQKQ